MAGSTCNTSLVLLLISVYYICLSNTISALYGYPAGSLSCKMYEMTKMDCSYRDLFEVPMLDQNRITELDLSHNHLMNITGAPFGKLQMLMMLNLGYNEISWMSSTAFNGLQSLKVINLQFNHLVDLANHIFVDLINLGGLILFANGFAKIPGETLAPLLSCEMLFLHNVDARSPTLEIGFSGFQNLTNLWYLDIYATYIKSNTSNNFLEPLSNLPLTHFAFGWWEKDDTLSINNMFAPLTSILHLRIPYEALPALKSLDSPLQYLVIFKGKYSPKVVDNTSLQVLQKWNKSLESFRLSLKVLKRIENCAFKWIPSLLTLNLTLNQITYLSKESFFGLKFLLRLDLSHNSLSHVPSDALKVFSKYTFLQYLDISFNKLDEMNVQDAFSAVSSSLNYLNLGFNNIFFINNINWTSLLQNLTDLTLTCSDCSDPIIRIDSYTQLPSLQKTAN